MVGQRKDSGRAVAEAVWRRCSAVGNSGEGHLRRSLDLISKFYQNEHIRKVVRVTDLSTSSSHYLPKERPLVFEKVEGRAKRDFVGRASPKNVSKVLAHNY